MRARRQAHDAGLENEGAQKWDARRCLSTEELR